MNYDEMIEFRNKNSKFAAHVGIRITEIKPGYAKGEMLVAEHHKNAIKSIHGGCLFSIADTIAGTAAVSRGKRMTTMSSDFHFLSPGIDVKKLIAVAIEIKCGKKISVYDVEVFNEKEALLAKGTFTFYNLDG